MPSGRMLCFNVMKWLSVHSGLCDNRYFLRFSWCESGLAMKKTVLITGGNSGIGLATAHELASRGIHVCMACRDQAKADVAAREIRQRTPGAEIDIFRLDLASLADIRRFAGEFQAQHGTLDGLVNNAGIYATQHGHTADGFEMTFGTNTLGPILLTELLLPLLENSDDGRMVHLSSMGHLPGRIDFDSFQNRRPYIAFLAYSQSKLGNLLYSHALARRTSVKTNAIHPGAVASPLYRELPSVLYASFRWMLIGPEASARLVSDLLLLAQYQDTSGQYFAAQFPKMTSRRSRDTALQEQFYNRCCELVGVKPRPVLARV